MNKQLVMALLASGALVGLSGCSEGDEATIVIDAPTTSNSNNTTNNPAPEPEPEPETEGDDVPCPAGTTETSADTCELFGTYNTDLTLVAGNTYTLNGRVQFGNGSAEMATATTLANGETLTTPTLTIEPGVEVKGLTASDGTYLTAAVLQINRGANIMAVGTADAPIILSSEDEGYEDPFEWGGLIVSGFGRHNTCSDDLCNITAEGGAGIFGQVNGVTADDNSGMLKYVVIAEGGYLINADGDEINGLSLNGVGSGTEIEYLQVHDNADDGIEFYGGDVNVKYAVVTGARDDSVDWDEGYQGNLQYIIVKQSAEGSGEAFEMDTQGADEPLSKPTVSNVTIIANKQADDDSYIMQFKKKSGGFFHNVVATVDADSPNAFDTCARITGGSEDNVGTSLVFNNWIQDCGNAAGDHGVLATVDMAGAAVNVNATFANLNSLGASTDSAAKLDAAIDWAAVNDSYAESVADADYLDETDYIGAVDPDATTAWWEYLLAT